MHKAKGGLRYTVMTADAAVHEGVAPRDITFSSKPNAADKGEIAARLSAFRDVRDADASVDAEVLEIAWEISSEEENALRLNAIAELLEIGSSPVDLYRTFKIMSSELGRVFFKSAKGEATKFNARANKAVQAAKQTLCSQADGKYGDFCLV